MIGIITITVGTTHCPKSYKFGIEVIYQKNYCHNTHYYNSQCSLYEVMKTLRTFPGAEQFYEVTRVSCHCTDHENMR